MLTRRQVLGAGLATLLQAVARRSRGEGGARPQANRVRYVLHVLFNGGLDSVYTTDPKTRADVEDGIDVPYASRDILTQAGLRVGPLLAPLLPHAGRMVLINGIQVRTANHNTGWEQYRRLKTGTEDYQMPGFLDLVGRFRDGQPLPVLTSEWQGGMGTDEAKTDALPFIASSTPEELGVMADALRRQARQVIASRTDGAVTSQTLTETAQFLDRLRVVEPFRETHWVDGPPADFAARLQRVVWAFKNDLTKGAYIDVGGISQPFDSHNFNADRQSRVVGGTVGVLKHLFTALESTRNEHGLLADQTLVIVGSEIGRFPRINGFLGKDHFPEAPLLLYGAGINTNGGKGAVYGQTGRRMEGLAVSSRSGRPQNGAAPLVLDDIGTTLLHILGIRDPEIYGYSGRVLEFLGA